MWSGYNLLANLAMWRKLPSDVQAATPKIKTIPARRPSTHNAPTGSIQTINPARIRSTTPLGNLQPQRRGSQRLCQDRDDTISSEISREHQGEGNGAKKRPAEENRGRYARENWD
jgi:hypothetical protein